MLNDAISINLDVHLFKSYDAELRFVLNFNFPSLQPWKKALIKEEQF